jgi:3-oxoacyl-[acyl-carrier protein] reductase
VVDRSPDLTGHVALVTGANQGIGAATAVTLARAGADVAVAYLRLDAADDEPGRPAAYAAGRRRDATAVVEGIEAAERRSTAVELDLADPSAPPRLFDQVEAELGPVTILVNNASNWRKDTFGPAGLDAMGRATERVSAATADAQLLVDARASALLISEFAARHMDRGADRGRIVGLTSGGPMGFPGEVSYGAAKAALENYTMAAAVELADHGVTANIVYPPVTDTGWVTDEVRASVTASPDHIHVAEPDDVAGVICWLCGDGARMVTGNIIRMR